MNINNQPYRTIWLKDVACIQIIDQRTLPHQLTIEDLTTLDDFATAIRDMYVRGAPLIGSTAAYGMYIAALSATAQSVDNQMIEAKKVLDATRPTAVNLSYATTRVLKAMQTVQSLEEKVKMALKTAHDITEESVAHCQAIGQYGLAMIKQIAAQRPNKTINILTHCNAGWMACIDYGTATAPIYAAQAAGIPIHVWVDETRPRNQGARITAYELQQQGVPHTVIPDNVGGHLMQHGMVDLCIVGSDRTTRTGDVANKIGTYLKALAAKDNQVPFYVALPSSTFDFTLKNGVTEIPIETRSAEEVKYIQGLNNEGHLTKVLLTPAASPAINYGFDVTPAHLVTGLITERGICEASEEGIGRLFDLELDT